LIGTSMGPQSIVPNLNPKPGYDPDKSFVPITLIGTIPSVPSSIPMTAIWE